jgi:capsular exopolysaccharide synthesis family protein
MVANQSESNFKKIVESPSFDGTKFNSEFDSKSLFLQIIRKWPIIILTIALGYFGANLYLKYTTPNFSALMKLLVKDTRYSSGMTESTIFADLGILNTSRNLDNEIQILKTNYLMEEVVKKLNLQYSYYTEGRLKTNELYEESPVLVAAWTPVDSFFTRSMEFELRLLEGGKFKLFHNNKIFDGDYGKAINLGFGQVTFSNNVQRNKRNFFQGERLMVRISPINTTAARLSRNLKVSVDVKSRSTVLELSFTDPIQMRASRILQELVNVYNYSEISDKNRIYEYTLRFIDERLEKLGTDLKVVEGNVASFKSLNGAVNLEGEGNILLDESFSSERGMNDIDAKIEIATYIRDKIMMNPNKFEILPTSDALETPSLFGLLNTFNSLILEREKLISTVGSKNPNIDLIDKQLNNLRKNIIENINQAERDLKTRRNVFASREKVINSKIQVIPEKEKQLIEIERQQIIKQQLYLYLLQKREETALSLNVTVANNRVIEPVMMQGQVTPKPTQVKLMGISLGLLLPIIIIILLQVMNNKVMVEDHIKEKTTVPILCTIPFTEQTNHVVISDTKRSAAAEMFRLMRANLQFIGEGISNKVIAITSSISGEGKSFITVNLGLTLAVAGKKVLIMEMDMRKPKLAGYLGHQKGMGKALTEYLVDDKIEIEEIIYKSNIHANLFYVPCGPIPPNPSELLLSEKLKALLDELKGEYDYVLIDTPPIGLVSDALLFSRTVDVTFYIVRQNLTERRQLNILEELRVNKKMPRLYVIFNGIKFGRGGYGYGDSYGHGYGYNYGYGYGYYGEDKGRKAIFSRIKGMFSKK